MTSPLRGAKSWQLVFDVRMKVSFDGLIGLFMITLQGQQVVASLRLDLARNGRLASHRINGHNTAFDGEQLEQCRNGRNLIRCGVGFDLAYDEAPLL
jgi:hypothetical protein